jgi:predicted DCC family thiol-disulfide oxidoreductase YuxK
MIATRKEPAGILLYDGKCPLCQRSVALLQRLDWFGSVRYQDARQVDQLPVTEPPLAPERLLEEMHLVPRDRQQIAHGFGAFRWLAWHMPLLWPLIPLLYLPGIPALGQKLYLQIARNRYNLVPCKDGVCELPVRPVKQE